MSSFFCLSNLQPFSLGLKEKFNYFLNFKFCSFCPVEIFLNLNYVPCIDPLFLTLYIWQVSLLCIYNEQIIKFWTGYAKYKIRCECCLSFIICFFFFLFPLEPFIHISYPLVTTNLVLVSKRLLLFLDSTYERDHIVFAFLCLTYFHLA